MTVPASTVRDLPDALQDEGQFVQRLAGRRPAVFLDYDGVLTPIVDRPETALSFGFRQFGTSSRTYANRKVGRDAINNEDTTGGFDDQARRWEGDSKIRNECIRRMR